MSLYSDGYKRVMVNSAESEASIGFRVLSGIPDVIPASANYISGMRAKGGYRTRYIRSSQSISHLGKIISFNLPD